MEPEPGTGRFPFYRRLSKAGKRTYDASDAITKTELRDPREARALARELEEALATGKRIRTQDAARALVRAIVKDLGTEFVAVSVLSRRPSSSDSELHGLYVREEGEDPRS